MTAISSCTSYDQVQHSPHSNFRLTQRVHAIGIHVWTSIQHFFVLIHDKVKSFYQGCKIQLVHANQTLQKAWQRIFASTTAPTIKLALQEMDKTLIKVTGNLPVWLKGTFVRNGPVDFTVEGKHNPHFFDGLACLVSFSIENGKAYHTSRLLRSDAYHAVFDKGSIDYPGFASGRSLLKRLWKWITRDNHQSVHNANVHVSHIGGQHVALTEQPSPVVFNLDTLDTLGIFRYLDNLPKDDTWQSAHSHYDPIRKETTSCLIQFGKQSYYVFYRMADNSSERQVVAKIPVDKPTYMHSFSVVYTNDKPYILLVEYPLVVNPLSLLLSSKSFMEAFKWEPQRGTSFTLIDASTGTIVKKTKTQEPCFSFHHANAFEKNREIHLDMVSYPDSTIIQQLTSAQFKNVTSTPLLKRYTFSLDTNVDQGVRIQTLFAQHVEFPRINDNLDGHQYQFVYILGPNKSLLYKFDTETHQHLEWSEQDCVPGEPVFIPRPEATNEDDGVVVSIVMNEKKQESFLVVLDATTFQEVARLHAPHFIPRGLHGMFFPHHE